MTEAAVSGRRVDDATRQADARVGEHDVEPAEPVDRGGDERLDIGLDGHVAAHADHGVAELDFGRGEPVGGEVADRHLRPFVHEPAHGGQADARRATGDDRDPAGEPSCLCHPVSPFSDPAKI